MITQCSQKAHNLMCESDNSAERDKFSFDDCAVLVSAHSPIPEISVIIPVHNANKYGYLTECLDSLLNQEFESIEIIAVDDASTDDSVDCLLSYASRCNNISVLQMSTNKRQGAARNRGISVSRGAFIGFVDADDVVHSQYYYNLIQKAKETGADVVAAPFVRTNSELEPIKPIEFFYPENVLGRIDSEKTRILIRRHCYLWAHLFDRHIVESNPFPEQLSFEDNPTALRWIYRYRHLEQLSKETPYFYRENTSSTTSFNCIDDKKLNDRIVTSNLMLEDSMHIGTYTHYREEIEYCYIWTLYRTGIVMLAKSGFLTFEGISLLLGNLRENIPSFRSNAYLAKLGIMDKAIVFGSSMFPRSFCIISTVALRVRKMLFGK